MRRFLAGGASALLLAGAGIFLWTSRAGVEPSVGKPAAPQVGLPLLGDGPGEAPSASARTREQKRFGRTDKDKNGIITAEEYFANRRKAFARLDGDHDGRLSFDEWAIKGREKFAKADGDRSTTLTPAEFATTAVVRKARPKCECAPARAGEARAGEGRAGEEDD